ncbi:hypothetical protein OC846_003082 [Tilletia horrida]|uniref:Exosome complex protein n=1 Tax=Tilletia horrida TaxID=155126 RepID=A0AAN6GQ62_9BASI|nr:hypothetical protein OC845_002803 [Tilletia horrida]KAK0551998.1 hypothetical protein OC846_003082 [Tilletia horrida]KAK0566157.1 hypothetical protein OC861_003378 [Tilletia horrida]
MDTLADPSPVAEALGPQLQSLYDSLGNILPSGSTTKALPSYEELIASVQSSSSNDQSDPLLGRLQAARMHASMAYLVLDAIWILMKTRGISLSQHHPINAELERARTYLEKVKKASGNDKRERDAILAAQEGPQRRVEAAAAGRFIKAALASQKGTLTKFDDDEEGNVDPSTQDSDAVKALDTGASALSSPAAPKPKQQKRVMDPYTEYDDEPPSKTRVRNNDTRQDEADDDEDAGEDEDGVQDTAADERKRRSKKRGKKSKRSKKR